MKAFIIVILLSFSAFAQKIKNGGYVGNGGDIRRYRAASALHNLTQALIDLQRSKKQCNLTDVGLNLMDLNGLEMNYQMATRTTIKWIEEKQSECLQVTQPDPANVIMKFSYENCPVVTPSSDYYDTIVEDKFFQMQFSGNKFDTYKNFKIGLNYIDTKQCVAIQNKLFSQPSEIYPVGAFLDKAKAEKMLEAGRKYAIETLRKIDHDDMSNSLHYVVRSFLNQGLNHEKLIKEIAQSKLVIDETAKTCARTQLKSLATIYFSPSACLDFQSDKDVAWVLIHEAVHHFGVETENYPDKIATEILNVTK